MTKIYIVEDDDSIRELVLYAVRAVGFEAEGFESGLEFWQNVKTQPPNLILLDIMLPNEDGLSILATLKNNAKTQNIPVIMLTAKSGEYDKIKGLDTGADDYITKPFSVLELISRIKAVLRRCNQLADEQILTIGSVKIDIGGRRVTVNGENIALTFKEFELLYCLVLNKGLALSREKIMELVWGFDFEGETRTVDMHIKTLRQKLGPNAELISTVRGIGYKIDV